MKLDYNAIADVLIERCCIEGTRGDGGRYRRTDDVDSLRRRVAKILREAVERPENFRPPIEVRDREASVPHGCKA